MNSNKLLKKAYTFDDLLLVPAYSKVLPNEVSLKIRLTDRITLNIPILSAAMDTVTESRLALALAQEGGLGIIHKNLTLERQVQEIKYVKNHTVSVTDYPNTCMDIHGKFCVGAAVGVGTDTLERVNQLVEAGANIISLDSAHGHAEGVISMVRKIRKQYPEIDLCAGNIVTQSAAEALIDAGANILKVGVGPGSICTTRVVAGVGVPQLTAINDVYEYCKSQNIAVIGDGGIQLSGDIVKALAAGASAVMLGSIFAGTDEAPGEEIIINDTKYKTYVGMGSLSAMERGSKDRYFQTHAKKLVPEGIEGYVLHKGSLQDVVFQLCGGIRAGMGYCGAATILNLMQEAQFISITGAGLKESHPHDIANIKAAPNYNA